MSDGICSACQVECLGAIGWPQRIDRLRVAGHFQTQLVAACAQNEVVQMLLLPGSQAAHLVGSNGGHSPADLTFGGLSCRQIDEHIVRKLVDQPAPNKAVVLRCARTRRT